MTEFNFETHRIPDGVNLNADMAQLTVFANTLGITVPEGYTEVDLASFMRFYVNGLSDADWKMVDPVVQSWANDVNEQVNKIKEAAAAAPATPAAPAAPAAGKTKTPKAGKTPKAPAAPAVSCSTFEQMIAACTKKADIIATATAAAKSAGKTIKLVKGWSVAKLKEEAIKQITAEAAPATPAAPKAPAPPAPKAAPKRVSANASAPDPSPKAVANAKAAAKANAQAAKAKASSAPGTRGREEGEPYRRNTTAWLVWQVLVKAKKALTPAEIKERFLADFEKSGLTSSNPAGRVNSIMAGMKKDGVVAADANGNYTLA